jgi:hypothetical protein
MTTAVQQQINKLLTGLTREDLITLLERIAHQLRQTEEQQALPLYGIWQGKFPEVTDLDKDLREIRNQWTNEDEELKSSE